jgi:hypothetical protein
MFRGQARFGAIAAPSQKLLAQGEDLGLTRASDSLANLSKRF